VVEVRDSSWDNAETLAAFAQKNVAFCNIDQPVLGRSLAPTEYVTARSHMCVCRAQLRSVVRFRQSQRPLQLSVQREGTGGWKQRIENVAERAQTTYVITNNHFESKAGVNALELKAMVTGKRVQPRPRW